MIDQSIIHSISQTEEPDVPAIRRSVDCGRRAVEI